MTHFRSVVSATAAALLAAQLSMGSAAFLGIEQAFADTVGNVTVTQSAPATVRPSTALQYSVTVRNQGTAPITGQLTDNIGSISSYVTFSPAQSNSSTHTSSCTKNASDPVQCTPVTIAAGGIAVFLLSFNVNVTAPCTGTLQNSAQFQITGDGSVNANTVTTTLQCPDLTDLKIEKTGPSGVQRGGVIIYTISAVYVSGGIATNVTVQDPFPAGLIFNASQSDVSCRQQNDLIICSTASLGPGNGRKDFLMAFDVPSSFACNSVISNTAAICKADQDDPNPGNDIFNGTVQTVVLCNQTGLTITKTDNRTTVQPGETLTYAITLTNPAAQATTGTVTDTLPTGLSFVSASDGGYLSGQTVNWSNISVPANASKTITVQATVSQSLSNGTVLTNTANVNGSASASDTTTVSVTAAQLTVSKTDNRTTVQPGETLTYSITIHNASVQTATVNAADVLPYGVSFLSASDGGSANGQTVTWSNLTINGYGNRTVTVQARVNDTLSNGTVITNTVNLTGASTASASDSTTVQVTTAQQLTIDITDDTDPVPAGEILTYTIRVTNPASTTQTVNVNQTLDQAVNFLSGSDNPQRSGTSLTWYAATIPARGTKTYTVTVRVDPDAFDGQSLRSRAYTGNASDEELTRVIRAGDETECNDGRDNDYDGRTDFPRDPGCFSRDDNDERDSLPPPPIGQTLLTVQKLADRGEAHPGEQVNYTITIRNLSNSVAPAVLVEDIFPTYQMTIVDPSSGILSGDRIIWNIQTLGPSEVRTITLRAQLAWNLGSGTAVQNSVRVSAPGMPTPVNAIATIQIPYRSPVTGADDFAGSLENTSAFLRPLTGGTASVGNMAGLLSTIAGIAGVAAGGFFSRRYFL